MAKKQLKKQIRKIRHQQRMTNKSVKTKSPIIDSVDYDSYENIEYLRHAANEASLEHEMGGYSKFFRNL